MSLSELRRILLRVVFNPATDILKKSNNEKIKDIESDELLKRWVNFQLKQSGNSEQIHNFDKDFKNCKILCQLANGLTQEVDFSPCLKEKEYLKRAKLFLQLFEKTSFNSYFCKPEDIVEGNAEEIQKFLAYLFVWKPNLRQTKFQTQSKRDNRPLRKRITSVYLTSRSANTIVSPISKEFSDTYSLKKSPTKQKSPSNKPELSTHSQSQILPKSFPKPNKNQPKILPKPNVEPKESRQGRSITQYQLKHNNLNQKTRFNANSLQNEEIRNKPYYPQKKEHSQEKYKKSTVLKNNSDNNINNNNNITPLQPLHNSAEKIPKYSQNNFPTEIYTPQIPDYIKKQIEEEKAFGNGVSEILEEVKNCLSVKLDHFDSVTEIIQNKPKHNSRKSKLKEKVEQISLLTFSNLSEDVISRYGQLKTKLNNILENISKSYPITDKGLAGILTIIHQIRAINSQKLDFIEKISEEILLNAVINILNSHNPRNISQDKVKYLKEIIFKITDKLSIIVALNSLKLFFMDSGILTDTKSEEYFAIESLFHYYLFSKLFRNHLSTLLFEEVIRPKFEEIGADDVKMETIKYGIFQIFERYLFGYLDFKKIEQELNEFLKIVNFSGNETKVKSIIEQSIQLSLGPTIQMMIENIISQDSKKLVQQSLEKFHQEQNIEFEESCQKGIEILGQYLTRTDIEYLSAAIDPNNCRESLEAVSNALFNLLEQLGITLLFIQFTIIQEVLKTQNAGSLFRSNNISTKLMSKYAVLYGDEYLGKALSSVTQELIDSKLSFEMDPFQLESGERIQDNIRNIKVFLDKFLQAVFNSTEHVPDGFRVISACLKKEVMCRFPDNVISAVGGFIFLRFICPAMVSPHSFKLINGQLPQKAQRGLLLLSTVIQALSNGVTFGTNRIHMQPINEDIIGNFSARSQFVNQISNAESVDLENLKIPKFILNPPNSNDPIQSCYSSISLKPIIKQSAENPGFINEITGFIQGFYHINIEFFPKTGVQKIQQLEPKLEDLSKDLFLLNKAFQHLKTELTDYQKTQTFLGRKESEPKFELLNPKLNAKNQHNLNQDEFFESANANKKENEKKNEQIDPKQKKSNTKTKSELLKEWSQNWTKQTIQEGWVLFSSDSKAFKKRYSMLKGSYFALFKHQPISASDKPVYVVFLDSTIQAKRSETGLFKRKNVILIYTGEKSFNAFVTDAKSIDTWIDSIMKSRNMMEK